MHAYDKIAAKIVDRILDDIEDRSGLGNEWGNIDHDIQREIIRTWQDIVIHELEKPRE